MYITKELSLLEGVKIHTVGHLRVRLLEVSESEIYLLPEVISLHESNGYLKMSTTGKNDTYVTSSNIHTTEGLVRSFKEQLVKYENHFKDQVDYFGIPLISSPSYLDPLKTVSGYFSIDKYLQSTNDLESAIKNIETILVPNLIRNKYQEKELTEQQVQDRMYFGSFLTDLFDKYHYEFLAAHLDVSPTNLRTMRANGVVNHRHAVKLKAFSDFESKEFFERVLRAAEYSKERMIVNSNINRANVAYALRTFRVLKGVSIFQLYKLTGFKEAALSRYETAKVVMSPDVFYTIFECLDSVTVGSYRDRVRMDNYRDNALNLYTKEYM